MRKKQPRGGIERKILSSILLVGTIPMALALISGYMVAHEAQRVAVQQNLSTAAQKTAEGLFLSLDARLRKVGTLSRGSEISEALRAVASGGGANLTRVKQRLATEAKFASDGPAVLSVYDLRGDLVVTTEDEPSDSDRHLPFLERAIALPRFVAFDYKPSQFRYVARIVAPVYGRDGRWPVGFVSEEQGVNSLMRFVTARSEGQTDRRRGDDVYQVVYGVPGLLFTSYFDKEEEWRVPLAEREPADLRLVEHLSDVRSKTSGAMHLSDYPTRDGKQDVLLAYRRLFDWAEAYILVYRPTAAVYGKINLGALLALAGCILVIAGFFVLAYRNVHNNIVRPVALLNEGAQIIRQGDLDLKLKIETGDEIEELASSFNDMARALKENIHQLGESEEKHRGLVTSMRDGLCQADPDGAITFINPAGLDVFGYAGSEDVVGKTFREVFIEEGEEARIAHALTAANFVERTRSWMRRRDGQPICIELSADRVYDDGGRFVGVEAIFRDVTRSVELEQAAQERSECIRVINQIANVINSSLEAGRLYESIAVEVRKLVAFDYVSLALLDEPGDAFEVRRLWPETAGDLPAPDHVAADACCAGWVARERRSLVVDDIEDGTMPFAGPLLEGMRSCICVPLYSTDRVIGALTLGAVDRRAFRKRHVEILEEMAPHFAVAIRNAQLLDHLKTCLDDVTQAREKLHEANKELKTLDEMKTNLLSNVSHELRTPLVSVMGYTDMIINEKAGPISDTQREYLTISLRNIEKLVTLIENLLDFSRLHRGAEELVFDVFDLADCARMSMQIVQPVADGREITLELAGPGEPVLVEGDKGKIGQVFNNLLANAVKFNHKGGKVTIELRIDSSAVIVSVIDTGIGIPAEHLDKVFTRFYQVDDSSTRKYGGTGIGLAIAQDIVRLHGSRLNVTSKLGEGSVFRFSMPLYEARKSRHKPGGEGDSPQVADTRLLIELVTEDRVMTVQVRNLLAPEGMDVVHASSPDYAKSLARKYSPDCILVDVESDEYGSGEAALGVLLEDDSAAARPLILLTNNDALYARCRSRVASRIKRSFRKSSLLSGIHYALGHELAQNRTLGTKVLCVDDDEEVLTFMQRSLEAEHYTVDCCTTGEAALERAKTREYGLILMDIAMPGIDGLETCRRIRADASLAGIKIYLVTAKPIDGSLPRFQECAADGCLLKPFKHEELVGLVEGFDPRNAVDADGLSHLT